MPEEALAAREESMNTPEPLPVVSQDEGLTNRPQLQDATRSWKFTEMLHDEMWPSLEELERAGAYDHEAARARILEWQRVNPRPTPPPFTRTSSADSGTIYDRRKLNLGPLPPPQLAVPSAGLTSPSSRSPSSPSMMSPLISVVRRASLGRPKANRTKSTNDAPCPPPAPLVSPLIETAAVKRWETPTRSQSATPDASFPVRLDNRPPSIAESSASRAGQRKLVRRSHAGVTAIRTDTDYLSVKRPSYSPHLISSPSALSAEPLSPTSQKRSWRRSFPIFSSSAPSTPAADHQEVDQRRKENRSPSPIDTFPREARREKPLPAVDSRRKKRSSNSSLSDSYLGDGEGSKPARSRKESAHSPSSGGMWSALRSNSRTKAGSRSDSDWDDELLERSISYEGLPSLPPKLSNTRSHQDPQVDLELEQRRKAVLGGVGSSSSLNLDKIEEQPEDPTVSRQPSLRNLIAEESASPTAAAASFGARTRTPSSNTTATACPSQANTSRAPSPTRDLSAKSSRSAFSPTLRLTPTPLDIPSEPASSASEESSPVFELGKLPLVPATPELIRSRGDTLTSVSSSSSSRQDHRRRLGGASESDLSLTSETTWDPSEGEEEETAASSAAEGDEVYFECLKEQRSERVQVEGEGVVGW